MALHGRREAWAAPETPASKVGAQAHLADIEVELAFSPSPEAIDQKVSAYRSSSTAAVSRSSGVATSVTTFQQSNANSVPTAPTPKKGWCCG